MTFAKALLVLVFLPAVSVQADNHCGKTVALLGSESGSQGESSRDEVLTQIADLYSLAINDKAPLGAAQSLIQELAEREGKTFGEVLEEVERMDASPAEKRARAEERRAIREGEHLRLLEGLEPYLTRIGREDRKVIEDTLIRPGLLNPLMTGEVGFRFQGRHRFVASDEGFRGSREGSTKEFSFHFINDFAIGKVPVTQLMYFLAALGTEGVEANPSNSKSGEGAVVLHLGDKVYSLKPNHPVENVSYLNAHSHAERASELTGYPYRLPDEWHWEFASRSEGEGKFHFGDDVTQLSQYAWFFGNSEGRTHEVGLLLPNAFNLYDTHGNVREWTSSSITSSTHIVRGGSWESNAQHLRSAYRDYFDKTLYNADLGFRLERPLGSKNHPPDFFVLGDSIDPRMKKRSGNGGGQR
jgi:hypothetical protein